MPYKKKIKSIKPSSTNSHLDNRSPRIIIINNISTGPVAKTITTKPSECNLFKLPSFEPCQRSLGCQTQVINDTNKIETACQTPILNIYPQQQQVNENHFEVYYKTQETQADPFTNFNSHQFDASTSPLNMFNSNEDAIINDDQFWADISTQTFLSAFKNQQPQIFTSISNIEQQTTNILEEQLFTREIQTCDIASNSTFTQTSQSTVTTANNTDTYDLDFIDNLILNSSSTIETQTCDNDHAIRKLMVSTNDDCNFIQTNSIQTQTFNEFNELVDNITQTPWDFSVSDDDLLF